LEENKTVLQHLVSDLEEVISREKEHADIPEPLNSSKTNGVHPGTDRLFPATDKLLAQLIDAVDRDDEGDLSALCSKVYGMKLNLSHTCLRAQSNNATVLHAALETERWKTAKFLILSGDVEFLSQFYNITIRKLPSKKYCLHILTEKGNYELTKLYLEQFTNEYQKNEILKQTVTMELEGQRPRPLASIHIAAMKGHTDLVELFHQLGMDVNTTNNKNDTPVLWAARGNHVTTVRRLIALGANLEFENDKGSTPLCWAVRYGFSELVKVLVTEGKVNVHQQRKLGLVSPIILASALGYHEIVDILLDYGADANTKMSNTEQTALHCASAEGNNDVIRLLLDKGKAEINHVDSNGNSALLFAAKGGNVSTMKVLIESGAQFDCTNRTGQNIWDIVMRSVDTDLLIALARLYKRSKSSNQASGKQKLLFPVGRTPLHVAAANGDVNQIRCLFKLGADGDARDLNGNTYFHVAAINDRSEVLKAFMEDVDVESVNADGNTVLHLAARSGHFNSVHILLSKSKLEARNKLGMTPLHMSVESDTANQDVIQSIVEVVVKASNWSLVDARDKNGSTALHIAAHHGRLEIFHQLSPLNPTLKNGEGNTPFHLAARSDIPRTLEIILDVFNRPEKGVDIDQGNDKGESTLHECVRRFDTAGVDLLVTYGSDIALKNHRGNTALHILVKEAVHQSHRGEEILEVYRTITHCSTKWWCMKYNIQYPSEGSEMFYQLLRTAMLHLTSYLYNEDGLNVIDLATKLCAVGLLDEILNTANVFRFKEIGEYVYDVTNLTPQTTTINRQKSKSNSSSIGVAPQPREAAPTGNINKFPADDVVFKPLSVDSYNRVSEERHAVSCLDIIVGMEDEVTAVKILDINPFKTLVYDYWNAYQWIYGLLMLVHITYMILFSVYVTPAYRELTILYNSSTISQCRQSPSTSVYGLFLVWPLLILVFELYQISTEIIRFIRRRCFHSQKTERKSKLSVPNEPHSENKFSLLGLPYLLLVTFFSYISHLTAIAFGCVVIAWFVLFLCATTEFAYVEVVSLVFILGWLFTISFTKGFEELHVFTIMLKYIVLKDITRFLIIYVFVLIGCGLAFNALFQISSTLVSEYPTAWFTLFSTFNLMLGLGGFFDGNFDATYAADGGNTVFIKCVYIFYIIMANIILMSLLIAMMTDTYTDIKSREGTTWRVGSLRLALRIERSMPCLKKILRAAHLVHDRISFDVPAERWIMSVSLKEAGDVTDHSKSDQVRESVHRLEKKLEIVTGQCSELVRQMESVSHRLNRISSVDIHNTTDTESTHLNMEKAIVKLMTENRTTRAPWNRLRAVMSVRQRPLTARNGRSAE